MTTTWRSASPDHNIGHTASTLDRTLKPHGVLQYSRIAETYRASMRRSFDANNYRHLLTSWAGLVDNFGFVLDIGCGDGTITTFLADTFPGAKSVVGVDASDDMIRLAQEDYPHLDFRVEDMERLSLDNAAADFVFSRFAVHYSDDLKLSLAEIGRATKRGGAFFLQDAHPLYSTFLKPSRDYEKKEDVVFPAQCDDGISVVHPSFTFEEYISAFTETGWSIQSLREVFGRHATHLRIAPYRVPTSVCFLLRKK